MAQHDLGGSWAAQRYCHSLARISGHVCAEHGGSSAKRPIAIKFAFWVRNRHSSYSQMPRSTPGGGWAKDCAPALSNAMLDDCVCELCNALRCSVNWKAESICPHSCQLLFTSRMRQQTHLRKLDQWRPFLHVFGLCTRPNSPRCILICSL